MIEEPTRYSDNSASLLDLIITESPGYLDDIGVLPPIGDLDHYIIHATINFVDYRPPSVQREVLLYNQADFDAINLHLFSAPWFWGFNNPNNSIDDIVHHYYTILNEIIVLCT